LTQIFVLLGTALVFLDETGNLLLLTCLLLLLLTCLRLLLALALVVVLLLLVGILDAFLQ